MRRKTKQQKDAEAKAALRQRLDDIYLGATGYAWDEDTGDPSPVEFMAFVMATRQAFRVPAVKEDPAIGNEHLWHLWALANYRNPETAAEFLFENDVRA